MTWNTWYSCMRSGHFFSERTGECLTCERKRLDDEGARRDDVARMRASQSRARDPSIDEIMGLPSDSRDRCDHRYPKGSMEPVLDDEGKELRTCKCSICGFTADRTTALYLTFEDLQRGRDAEAEQQRKVDEARAAACYEEFCANRRESNRRRVAERIKRENQRRSRKRR